MLQLREIMDLVGRINGERSDMTAEEYFELVSSYMNEEHVNFVKKAYEVAKACP